MPYILYASWAAIALAIVALLYVAAKLAGARIERDDAREEVADLKRELADAETRINAYRKTAEDLLTELTGFREKAALVRAGALKASRASAEARKSRLNAH